MRELLEQILRGRFEVFEEICTQDKQTLIESLQEAVAIDATNVHEWKLTDKHSWQDRLPHLPPRTPFPYLWVEWVEMVREGKHYDPFPMGLLVEELEYIYNSNTSSCIFRRIGPELETLDEGDIRYFGQAITVFLKLRDRIVTVAEVHDQREEPTADKQSDSFWFERTVVRDEDGSYTSAQIPMHTCEPLPDANQFGDWASVRALETYLPMLVFMNCRNVTLNRLTKPAKTQKKFQKRYHVRRPSFHVIEVHKSMVRNVYEQGVSDESVMHAHMVRGHVKHYGEHNKLFGKIVGSWFWQSHVRGDIGTPAVSDYRVWGPSDGHERHCDIERVN